MFQRLVIFHAVYLFLLEIDITFAARSSFHFNYITYVWLHNLISRFYCHCQVGWYLWYIYDLCSFSICFFQSFLHDIAHTWTHLLSTFYHVIDRKCHANICHDCCNNLLKHNIYDCRCPVPTFSFASNCVYFKWLRNKMFAIFRVIMPQFSSKKVAAVIVMDR